MSQRNRQLLPVPSSDSTSQSQPSASSSTPLSSEKLPKRQRIGTQLACNGCRRKKVRCDGQRPQCRSCQQRGEQEPCTYAKPRSHSQPRKETEQILELFDLLRAGSENQALDGLRVLRSRDDVDSVLDIIKASRSQEQRPRGREWAPISTRHLGLEYELMARNAVAFPSLQAFESNVIESVTLHHIQAFFLRFQSNVLPTCSLMRLQSQAYILQGSLQYRSPINHVW
ncbi:hypothetical protein FOFC_03576 [Fusarium oxysporum]|nr:hypothetical protein FOFC_03576 [Fusarium oxysporum]